jgi:hypothetical protein
MICSSVNRLFFIKVLSFTLRENSSFPWLSFPGAGQGCIMTTFFLAGTGASEIVLAGIPAQHFLRCGN